MAFLKVPVCENCEAGPGSLSSKVLFTVRQISHHVVCQKLEFPLVLLSPLETRHLVQRLNKYGAAENFCAPLVQCGPCTKLMVTGLIYFQVEEKPS